MIKVTEHKISFFDDTETTIIPVVQGDTGRVIKFIPTDAKLTNSYTAKYFVLKPSGLAVYYTATITNGSVVCELTAQALAEKGDAYLNVRIFDNSDVVVSSFRAVLKIQKSPVDAIESTNDTNIFDQAVEDAIEEIGNTLDPTLTLANKAAEAKAVGDALAWDPSKYNRPKISRGTGQDSTQENLFTQATGMGAHSEGISTQANGIGAHSEGSGTIAGSDFQHVSGKYNIVDTNGTYVEIVGNGVADAGRNNARTLDWNGNEALWGDLTIFKGNPRETKVSDLKHEIEDISMYTLGLYPQKSVADVAVASFADGADDIPVKSLTVDIEPVQSGSGDPSPENVRAITGWTRAKVTRSGRNLLPNVFTSATTNGITFTVRSDGTVNASGTATAVAARSAVVRLKVGTYILSGSPSGASGSTYEIQAEINGLYKRDFGSGVQFDITEDCDAQIFLAVRDGQTVENLVFNPMLRLVSDIDSTYEPYSGNTYDITFPTSAGTVYGGTLDVTNGVLTVDRANVDMGTLSWSYASAGPFFYASLNGVKIPASWTSAPNIISSLYLTTFPNGVSSTDFSISIAGDVERVMVHDSRFTDATTFKTNMSGVQLVYELATPQTYQLNPREVTTLLKNNNLFADTGNVNELTYRADLKTYIDEKLA